MPDVLIVDDSLTVRMDLKEALDAAGISATLCGSAEAARRELASSPFGVAVLDILLPDGDGIDLLREIRANPRIARLPVLLLSGEAELADCTRDLPHAADGYIGKPYDRERVVAGIRRLLASSSPAASPDANAPTVLLVDDSPTYLAALSAQLQQDGMHTVPVRSGEAALEALPQHRVDCILLDLIMPGLSGEETCQRIRSSPQWQHIPVIMLTAREESEAMLASFNAGADDFISKSSDFSVLRARLRAQLRRRQLEEEHRRVREQLHQKEVEAAEARANRELAETRASLLKDLERAKEAAEQANRAKDHFLAVLSHELRTPLTPVLAAASAMEHDPRLPEDLRQDIRTICRNVELETRLIDDLLDLTRVARGKLQMHMRHVEIAPLLQQTFEICQPDLRAKKLHATLDIRGGPYVLRADPARIQQVVWNLLKNAVKFTREGGSISVRAFSRQSSDGTPSAPSLVIEVSDTGIGISREALPRIFDAFEQADRSVTRLFGGLGLGLAICRSIVSLHSGAIRASSEGPGRGSTFTVELPLAAAATPPATPASGPGAGQRSARPRLRVLLVEDHADTAKIMSRLLQIEGHEVHVATNVASALDLAAHQKFDLLLSDLGLPDGSGLDLMRQLRRQYGMTGIAMSGYGMEEDIRRSKEAGFVEHVTKPVSTDALHAAIARAGAKPHPEIPKSETPR